jgi:hypothetical protein
MMKSKEIFHKKQDGLLVKAYGNATTEIRHTSLRVFVFNKNSISSTTFTQH